MDLSQSQLQTIKGWVVSNNSSLFDTSSVNALNTNSVPDYWCWRTSVEKKEVVQNASASGTSFIWNGNGFIGRSVGELECWNQLFNSTLTCNPSLPNVRQAFSDIFSGTGNAALNRTHLMIVSRRKATVAERLLAVSGQGLGNDGGTRGTPTNPDNFGVGAEGLVTIQNVINSESA
jgi:hypothetical protein